MRKWLRRGLLGSAIAFALIQFVPAAPPKTNPPVDPARTLAAVLKPPQPVLDIFDRACNDCHSHDTRWPWYADVAPVSWSVRQHVAVGRQRMNFSEWLKPGEKTFSDWHAVEEICHRVKDGSMPLSEYVRWHPEAVLTAADRQAVCAWVESEMARAK